MGSPNSLSVRLRFCEPIPWIKSTPISASSAGCSIRTAFRLLSAIARSVSPTGTDSFMKSFYGDLCFHWGK
jgi:hypothetical protein